MDPAISKKLEVFFSQYPKLTLSRKTKLIKPGKNLSHIFFLKSGLIRQFCLSHSGQDITIHIFKPYSFLPTAIALQNIPHNYHFETLTKSILHQAPKEDVLKLLKADTEILLNLTSRLSAGLMGLGERITHLTTESAYKRIILTILHLAEKYAEEPKKPKDTLTLPVSQVELSSWTGVARETVTRQINVLKRKGLLQTGKKALLIPSLSKLNKELKLSQQDENLSSL